MIDADALHEAEQEALGQVAQMDLSLAKRLHARAMEAEDTKELVELARAYQRASRCVRQTIMLRAKLRHDRERHLLATTPAPTHRPPFSDEDAANIDPVEWRIDGRVMDLQEAASRIVVAAARPGTPSAERLDALDRIDVWIDREIEEHPDFGLEDLDDHVLIMARAFNLPEDLARRFRDLPRAPSDEYNAEADYIFGPHPQPGRRETG